MEDYSHLSHEDKLRLKDIIEERYWNAVDLLGGLTVSRAAILNALKDEMIENCYNNNSD